KTSSTPKWLRAQSTPLFSRHGCSWQSGLARGAGSNPTAFQAVSFQPPRPGNGGWGGRVSPKRARGDGPQVPRDMGDEVSVQDSARGHRRAGARPAETDLRGAGSDDYSWGGVAGPHPHAARGAAAVVALEAGAVPEREVVAYACTGIRCAV